MEDESKSEARTSFFRGNPIARVIRKLRRDQHHRSSRSDKDLGTSGETAAVNKRRAQEQFAALDIEEEFKPKPTEEEYNPELDTEDSYEPNWRNYAHEGVPEKIRLNQMMDEDKKFQFSTSQLLKKVTTRKENDRKLRKGSKAKHLVGNRYGN
ncbi:MAG: hypothetical protein OEX81_02385 [Candidatus Pacebacteria bacterium]|nr:hypothetical protein [Candidatus Paceibacterota bacterium]